METWLIPLITFICGWKMAKGFYRVNDLMLAISVLSDVMVRKMTPEEGLKIFKELSK